MEHVVTLLLPELSRWNELKRTRAPVRLSAGLISCIYRPLQATPADTTLRVKEQQQPASAQHDPGQQQAATNS